jgi:hypothetical protein
MAYLEEKKKWKHEERYERKAEETGNSFTNYKY